jgi:hypothetical protein
MEDIMQDLTRIGIDLGKHRFHAHANTTASFVHIRYDETTN